MAFSSIIGHLLGFSAFSLTSSLSIWTIQIFSQEKTSKALWIKKIRMEGCNLCSTDAVKLRSYYKNWFSCSAILYTKNGHLCITAMFYVAWYRRHVLWVKLYLGYIYWTLTMTQRIQRWTVPKESRIILMDIYPYCAILRMLLRILVLIVSEVRPFQELFQDFGLVGKQRCCLMTLRKDEDR